MTMKSVSVSDLKARLSEHLRHVARGEEVVVTDRGAPIARLIGIDADGVWGLERLAAEGGVRLPVTALPEGFWAQRRTADPTGSLRAAILDEREDR